ncbi:MAG: hypothetical protein NTV89_05360 [Proteobacteria bacterium]|nr:hypothetical protein [Pseudomonadota bacterium]
MKRGIKSKNSQLSIFLLLLLVIPVLLMTASCVKQQTIGVIFALHGGFDNYKPQYLWDSSVQMFSYDPKHPVYQLIIWTPDSWGTVLQLGNAPKEIPKYAFEYQRLGGTDPFAGISAQQFANLKAELESQGKSKGFNFVFDYVQWMSGDDVSHYAYPRFLYNGPPGNTAKCNYCGEKEADGPWPGCDPERYNVDGPVDRLIKQKVSRIIIVDMTVGGVRFSKTFDSVQMIKRALKESGNESIPVTWVNDYTSLMERSYPTEPAGWTATMGAPTKDVSVPLEGSPNPVAADPDLAALHVEGIEAGMSDKVSDAETGVIILNHAINDNKEYFDPKINDTLLINKNIKSQLISRHPGMNPANIIGAYMGIYEADPDCKGAKGRTRNMRGENLGYAWLYESAKQLPGDEWGYLYWDALEYLKNRGVKHIVIGFAQIVTDSVLNLVEIQNQIAKEIGTKTWLHAATGDTATYPGVGNPFAEYWGMWVRTDCGGMPCCFKMGGCNDGGVYPPPVQKCPRDDLEPSLAYAVSEYGNLGYDQALGAPDPAKPVQQQYTGTWAMWTPPNDDPRLSKLLAKYVLQAANDELK